MVNDSLTQSSIGFYQHRTRDDTLTVLQDGRPARIRLANVDAPEKRQGFGERAKQSFSDLCYRKDAVLKIVSTDRYGRAVALVWCAGIDVNRAQVERGLGGSTRNTIRIQICRRCRQRPSAAVRG
jgi:endonuclease YncB( thermonuclease family)